MVTMLASIISFVADAQNQDKKAAGLHEQIGGAVFFVAVVPSPENNRDILPYWPVNMRNRPAAS